MKNIIKYSALILLSIFLSCEKKEINIQTSFDFEIKEDHQSESIINSRNETNFTIDATDFIESNKFSFSYSITNGNGNYLDDQGNIIPKNTFIPISVPNFTFNFIGTEIGETIVRVQIKDSERTEEINIIYNISNSPLSVTLNSVGTKAVINEPKNFSVILNSGSTDKTITYKARLFLSKGSGIVETLNSEGQISSRLNQNEKFDITPGTFNYQLTLFDEGLNVLNVEVEDSNGQLVTSVLEIAVNVINFDFTAEAEQVSTIIGSDVNINFNIRETDGGNANYETRFILQDGNIEIFNQTDQIFAGTNISVPLGSFNWIFRPIETGEITVAFVTKNDSGVEKTQILTITVLETDFSIEVIREKATATVSEEVKVAINITETLGNGDTFQAFYTSSSNGIFTYDSVEYLAGELFDITDLNSFGTYRGNVKGDHQIELTIISNSNDKRRLKSVIITYEPVEFDLTVKDFNLSMQPRPNGPIQNDVIRLNHLITEMGGTGSYRISFTTSNVSNLIRNESGEALIEGLQYDVNSLSFDWFLNANNVGSTTINYKVDDGLGTIEEFVKEITIRDENFNFTTNLVGSNQQTTTPFEVRFNMNAPNTLNYFLTVTSSDNNNIITFNGRNFRPEQEIPVISNDFSIFINSSKEGNNNFTFKIRANNNIEKSTFISTFLQTKIVMTRAIATFNIRRNREPELIFETEFTKGRNDQLSRIIFRRDDGIIINQTVFSPPGNNTFRITRESRDINGHWFLPFRRVSVQLVSSNGTLSNIIEGVVNFDIRN